MQLKADSPLIMANAVLPAEETTSTPVIMSITQNQLPIAAQSLSTSSNSIVVSVPLTATSLPNTVQSTITSASTLYQQLQQSMITSAANADGKTSVIPNSDQYSVEETPSKRSR